MNLISDTQWCRFVEKREAIESERARLKRTYIQAGSEQASALEAVLTQSLSREYSLAELLKRQRFTTALFMRCHPRKVVDDAVAEQVMINSNMLAISVGNNRISIV